MLVRKQRLKAGTNVGFPEQGTPQGGVVSPLLANIALNGIESLHSYKNSQGKIVDNCVRYADDMVFILKPEDDAQAIYWSERNSKLYDDPTSKTLKRQNHTCSSCGLKFVDNERIHLHHIDGNHQNWKRENLEAIHESCHDYSHMSKGKPENIGSAV